MRSSKALPFAAASHKTLRDQIPEMRRVRILKFHKLNREKRRMARCKRQPSPLRLTGKDNSIARIALLVLRENTTGHGVSGPTRL